MRKPRKLYISIGIIIGIMWAITVFGGQKGRTIMIGNMVHHENTLQIKRSTNDILPELAIDVSDEFRTGCRWVVGIAGAAMIVFPLLAWQMTIPVHHNKVHHNNN